MRRILGVMLLLLLIGFVYLGGRHTTNYVSVDDSSDNDITNQTDEIYSFTGYVYEVSDTFILITPTKSSNELNSSYLFSVSKKNISDESNPSIGDTYEITYDGMILETYPAKLNKIYEMKRIGVASKQDYTNYIKLRNEDTIHTLFGIDVDALESVISKYEWKEANSNCLYDYELSFGNVNYTYHSDCGTLNDLTNYRSITLNDTDQEHISDLLNQFVSERHFSSGPIQKIEENN